MLAITFSKGKLLSIDEINAKVFVGFCFVLFSTCDGAIWMSRYVYTKSWENKHNAGDTRSTRNEEKAKQDRCGGSRL